MSIIIDMSKKALRASGLRLTKQRALIVEALEHKTGFTTAQELFHQLRKRRDAPGLATVYRTLATLAAAGALDSSIREGEQVFRLCGSRHHHHLVCESCGRVEEVASQQVEAWVKQVARRRGFRVTGHTADVYGICASCS